ncbi:hypothetical protein BGZ65_006853, partial [Modicella reniformis]
YQDTWVEIHNHTTRNSERANDAEEILARTIELCTRHVKAAAQFKEEAKDLKNLNKSLDEMVSMAENIQNKLVGLESVIEKLEEKADVMSLTDWKRVQTAELDKYMEAKRKDLWDKAELLSTRSKQFQKEESARKLQLYQNQFQTDMAKYRRTQEEKKQELWNISELENETLAVPITVLMAQKEEERKQQEDLDRFLGPASDNDSNEGAEEDNMEDDDDEDEDEDDDDDDDDDEDEESSEDDLDPIAKARKARVAAAAAAAAAATIPRSSTGSTISAFSALANHPSTTSLSKP